MTMMKLTKLLVVLVFLTFAGTVRAQTSELPVKALGNFMRVESDGEHASGYNVELWKQGDKIIGLINAHDGLIGDPPAGLLENVRYDRRTGKFSFTAKLSLAVTLDDNYQSIPTRELFEFHGILSKTRLTGNLTITQQQCSRLCVERKRLNLPRSKKFGSWVQDFKSYADWKKDVDEILDFRGPKW
jgi:hypothetical protein